MTRKELRKMVLELITAIKQVSACWERGDLSGAMRAASVLADNCGEELLHSEKHEP